MPNPIRKQPRQVPQQSPWDGISLQDVQQFMGIGIDHTPSAKFNEAMAPKQNPAMVKEISDYYKPRK